MQEFRDLFDEAPIAYIHEGPDSRFIRVNQAAMQLLGLAPETIANTFATSLAADTEMAQGRLRQLRGQLQRGSEVKGVVVELRRQDNGLPVWVEWSSKPAAGGQYTRTMLVDITERVLLDQTRRALEFSMESGQIGDWDLDLVRQTSRRSLRHDQCFGYSQAIPESQWGVKEFLLHVHPEDRERLQQDMRAAIESRSDWAADFRVIWPDGSQHWLVARGRVYQIDQGRPTRMLGVVMDVTDRKRTEEALGASDRFARGQVEALTRTLDALAAEPSPERLAEHVLRTIAGQLEAQSCSVWRRDEESGLLDFQCSLEAGKFYLAREVAQQSGVPLRISMHEFWPDEADLMAGQPAVMEDIRVLENPAWRTRLMGLGVVSVLMVPMSIGGRVDGTIGIRFTRRREFLGAEIDLAKALANQTMLALQLTRLSAQSRESAVIAERNRLARDIHDTLAQGFTGVIVQLEAAADASSKGLAEASTDHVKRAKDLARESLSEARRSVRALRPKELDDKELSAALEVLVRKMTAGTAIETGFTLEGRPCSLPAEWDENLLRIVQEGLTNALRHARAQRFDLKIAFEPERIALAFSDDGRGFDPALKSDGFGLVGIGERVEGMGGILNLMTAPGAGVSMSISLPLPADAESAHP